MVHTVRRQQSGESAIQAKHPKPVHNQHKIKGFVCTERTSPCRTFSVKCERPNPKDDPVLNRANQQCGTTGESKSAKISEKKHYRGEYLHS